ncbi:HEAT repeat domain-containing protein [Polyangium sp. 6x1]|uniref:HEAT repeat domain-containing protein n=1 Tax=Polyangium sp. 6x1 TaxID=3042689 RepID=UPI002482C2A3|nr:HEAT repeat domain-containing protein [Polyangium sp. 6x1]MDI1449415.1 HEAT repeat domain-containing protein [Polyangium sp. 6x1]
MAEPPAPTASTSLPNEGPRSGTVATNRDKARHAAASSLLGIALSRAEIERVALLSSLLFLSALLLVVGRTARDALFLTRFPVTWIAPMWMAYGVVSAVVAFGYERGLRKLPRARFGAVFALGAAASYVLLRLLIGKDIGAAYLIFAIWADVIANLTGMLAWSIAQDLYDARSARRIFGLIGAGHIAGTVVSGLGAGAIAPIIGAENLIFVLVAALLGVALLCRITARRHGAPSRGRADDRPGAQQHDPSPLWSSRYVGALAVTILVVYTILTVGDYQFKAIARTSYPDRDSLARFMGTFYGAIGMVGLFVQLVVTPRMLDRAGVLGGAATMPVAFLASTALLLAFPSMPLAAVLKASDNALQFSIFDVTLQILFFPFPAAHRDRVRTLASAIMKPLGCGVGAALLLAFSPSASEAQPGASLITAAAQLGYVTLPLGLLIMPLLLVVRRGYVEAMQGTLLRGKLTPEMPQRGGRAVAALAGALSSLDAPQVLFALDRLRQLDPARVREALPALTRHVSSRVRAAALRTSRVVGHPDAAALARERLEDPDPEVRGIAVELLANALGEDAHEELCALAARGGDEAVRAASIAALLRHGGLGGMLEGAPRLRDLLDSEDPAERVTAARVLGLVGQPQLERAVARLLADADPAVRKAALSASATVAAPKLLPLLCEALADHALGKAASNAIVALGDRAIPRLVATLSDPQADATVRLAIPRLLSRIGTSAALAALLDRVDEPDDRVRQKVLASASRLRLALGAPPAPLEPIRERIEREAHAHERERDAYLLVRPRLARPLLDAHVERRLRKGLIRILRLCELVYPRDVVAGVRTHVFGKDRSLRANAFEVLESLLDRRRGARLVALFERYLELAEGLPRGGATPSTDDVVTFVRSELQSNDPYRAALVLEAVAVHRIEACASDAILALDAPDPLVREAAAIAVVETHAAGAEDKLKALAKDPDRVVARWAAHWEKTGRSGLDAGDGMYTTIEKVLFLQRVPILSKISGEELVGLARTSEVLGLPRGEVIFRQGDAGAALYFIISGSVSLRVEGKEVVRLGANEVFGETSIIDREPRAATAVSLEPVELLRVSGEDFSAAVHDTAEIAMGVLRVVSGRLREADRRLSSAEAELARLRRTSSPKGEQPPSEDDAGATRRSWEDDE